MGDRLHQGGLSSRAIRWAALATVVVAAAVTTVLLTRTDEGGGTGELSADFTPESGSVVPSGDVRAQLVEALQRLLAEPFVSVESVGFTEGRRSDVVASVDVVGRRMSSRELISDGVQVGEPRSAHPLISELVVLGNDGWLRVLQPAESADTPFQFIDATGDADHYFQGAYTQLGRVFDSLSVLAALLSTTPFDAERLAPRGSEAHAVEGVRTTFDSRDVARFLESGGLAVVGTDITGSTVFEFWYDTTGLRQLVATGVQFEDGEALQTSARIDYRVETSLSIEAPLNTVPR